tara:strand:- start:160734 stop:162035 length:1302 start_codon:yes stop_codon:yes gene_type:complete
MPKKRILLFTYYWPPSAGPGVQRWLKFCKFLSQMDFDITVISPQNPSASNFDSSLESEIPQEIELIKTKSFEPFEIYKILKGKRRKENIGVGGIGLFDNPSFKQRAFNYIRANYFIPDARKGWNKFAIKAAEKLIAKQNFDAIITTGPPQSSHLIGYYLQKKFSLPWLADFRDPWVNVYYNKLFPRTKASIAKDQKLEDKVLKNADACLVVSPGLKAEFSNRAKSIEVVYNGFDAEDLPTGRNTKNQKFKISYIGNFKPNQNCESLWKAISNFSKNNREAEFQITLIGNVDPLVQNSISEFGLDNYVIYEAYKPHKEATLEMVNADVLLFIIPQTEDNELILTGKLFEYLASGTELLSIGPEKGNASSIIKETGRGEMFDYANGNQIEKRLEDLYQSWKDAEINTKLDRKLVNKYSRLGMTELLATTLRKHIK